MSPQQTQQAPSWTDFASGLPQDIPDEAFDALRERFFNEHVAPDVLRSGYNLEPAHQQWMKKTERAEKSSHPRASVVAMQALSDLAAPFAGATQNPTTMRLAQEPAERAAQDAQRQGIDPTPYQFAGSMLGQAPYWAAGLGAASELAGMAEAGPLFEKAIKTAAGGVIQGSYDALKSGGNVIEGLKGAAGGAGMVAGFEAAGSLKNFLMQSGVDEAAAHAIGQVAKGTASESQWQSALDASLKHSRLNDSISQWVGDQVKAAKQAGVASKLIPPLSKGPVAEAASTASRRLEIGMTGADGKPYQLQMDSNNADVLIDRLNDHLQAGGSITQINGSAKAVSKFYQLLSMSNPESFDLDLPLKEVGGESSHLTIPSANSEAIQLPSLPKQTSPTGPPPVEVLERVKSVLASNGGATLLDPSVNIMDAELQRVIQAGAQKGFVLKTAEDGTRAFGEPKQVGRLLSAARAKASIDVNTLINARNSYFHATDLEGFRGILENGEIKSEGRDVEDFEVEDEAEKLAKLHPDWNEDQLTDAALEAQAANRGVSVSRSPRLSSKADKAITFVIDAEKMPAHRPYVESGYGKQVEGYKLNDTLDVQGSGFNSESILPVKHKETLPEWLAQGFTAESYSERNSHFEFEQRTYNEPIPLSAVRGIVVDKEAIRADLPNRENPELSFDEQTPIIDKYVQQIRQLAAKSNIPLKIMESGREVHSYRAGLSKQPEGMRWATEIPLYDQLEALPSGQVRNKLTGELFDSPTDALSGHLHNEKASSTDLVRGSASIPLDERGQAHVDHLGERIAAKGGLDSLVTSDSLRTQQTSSAILDASPQTRFEGATPALQSWASGSLEGSPHTPEISDYKSSLARDFPDHQIGGMGPLSTRPGESFNDMRMRVLPYVKSLMDKWREDPTQKVGVVTHFSPIRLIEAWVKNEMPEDFSVDPEEFIRERAEPGGVYKLAPRGGVKAAGDLSRRELLKRAGAAGASLGVPELTAKLNQMEGALKGAEAGSKVAAELLDDLVSSSIDARVSGFGKGYVKIVKDGETLYRTPEALSWAIRYDTQGEYSAKVGLARTLADLNKLPKDVQKTVLSELKSLSREDLVDISGELSRLSDNEMIDTEPIDKIFRSHGIDLGKIEEEHQAERRKENDDWEKKYRESQAQQTSQRVEQLQRPTGQELTRTHLGLGEEGQSGQLMRYVANLDQQWSLRKMNMENDQPLEPGIYLIRHGETSWNKGGEEATQAGKSTPDISYKETPFSHRFYGDIPEEMLPERALAGTIPAGEGQKSTIAYRKFSKELSFHENLHGGYAYTGLTRWIAQQFDGDGIVHDIFHGAFPSDTQDLYSYPQAEEVFNYAASAVRVGNEALLDSFGRADTDKQTVLHWTSDTANDIRQKLAEASDSLQKRTLERQLGAVVSRASGKLDEINRPYAPSEMKLDISGLTGRYVVREDQSNTYFESRPEAIEYMEQQYQEPLQSPELVPTQYIPDGTPRYATKIPAPTNTPPNTSEPTSVELTPPGPQPIKAGTHFFSAMFRPIGNWIQTVAQDFNRPELGTIFGQVDGKIIEYNNAIRPFLQTLSSTLMEHRDRQTDFLRWIQAADTDRPFIEKELNFKPEELTAIKTYETDFLSEFPDLKDFLTKDLAALQTANYDPKVVYPRGKSMGLAAELVTNGRLNPKDTNLVRMSSIWLRSSKHGEIVEPTLQDAEKLVDEKIGGKPSLGNLTPVFRRYLAHLRGTPDNTARAIQTMLETAVTTINEGFEKINSHLPDNLQIPTIDEAPQDLLQKYIMLQYAGALAVRPGVLARASLQTFITGFPIMGNYIWKGMERSFEVAKEGTGSDAWQVAQRYGAFIEKAGLQEMLAGGSEMGWEEHLADKALKMIQWGHNSSRLVSFWGHTEQALDALREHADSPEDFSHHSGLWFLQEGKRTQYLKELQHITPDRYEDFSRRIGAELTNATQWNYRKGANPGMYMWQLGRLFGQYGTWPLNYIEYARRFAGASDRTASMQALGRLVLAHESILAAGAAVGIDTQDWVFLQPMAWGGGPMLQATVGLPTAIGDWHSERGSEARQELLNLINPLDLAPGAEEAHELWKAISSNDPNAGIKMLGFKPLKGER